MTRSRVRKEVHCAYIFDVGQVTLHVKTACEKIVAMHVTLKVLKNLSVNLKERKRIEFFFFKINASIRFFPFSSTLL